MHILRDGTDVPDVRLDRIPFLDPRSLDYRIRGIADPTSPDRNVTRLWTAPPRTPVLNQGQQGACVGFGVTHELLFNPVPVPALTDVFARERIYWTAQHGDPWDGGAYPGATPFYEGTGVLFGIKTAADLGYYTEYRWATSEPELGLGISQFGPAIIGVDWYEGMFNTDRHGYIHATGRKVGGHCLLGIGINYRDRYYTLRNSWGRGWGTNGNAKISRADMAKLLAAKGEACVITRRGLPAAVSA